MVLVRKKIGRGVYVYRVEHGRWSYLGKEKPIEEWVGKIHCGDAYQLLPLIPSESIDCVITSPPYYGLRIYGEQAETVFGGDPGCEHEWSEESVGRTDYTGFERRRRSLNKTAEVLDGHPRFTTSQPPPVEKKSHFCVKCGAWKGQLGLEPSWKMYVQHLVELFREVKRVLKKTGSFWLNIGDTYAGNMNWTEEYANKPQWHPREPIRRGMDGYQPKCLMGIPWRVAFALIDDGWILRNAVVWFKPNHMPDSAKDRLTRTYEFLFHFVKSRRYYYNLDNIREPPRIESLERWERALRQKKDSNVKLRKHDLAVGRVGNFSYTDPLHVKAYNVKGKNPGDALLIPSDFWSIPTKPFRGAHFAVFPPELPLRPILASCPPDGIVLDPFAGSGTVAYVCELINRGTWDKFRIYVNDIAKNVKWNLKWILIDVNPEYCRLAEERLKSIEG
jgi:site-specific DNA-methyltransferase (cytosine-N4-specific)